MIDPPRRVPGQQQCGQPRCRESILWVRMSSGRSMPVDAIPNPEGTVAVVRDVNGKYSGHVLAAGETPMPFERLHITHFATCKDRPVKTPATLPPNVIPMRPRVTPIRPRSARGR